MTKTTVFYLDTEFTELTPNCKLISLALTGTDGREFYIELTDHWFEDECSDFTRENVLPQLNLELHGMTYIQAATALHRFLANSTGYRIACDAPIWDLPLVYQLLGRKSFPGAFVDFRILNANFFDTQATELPTLPTPNQHQLRVFRPCCLDKTGMFSRLTRCSIGLAHVRIDDIMLADHAATLIGNATDLPPLARSIQEYVKGWMEASDRVIDHVDVSSTCPLAVGQNDPCFTSRPTSALT
jgi:hypothetical protein